MIKQFTKQNEDFLRQNWGKTPESHIAKILGFTTNKIRQKARKLGLNQIKDIDLNHERIKPKRKEPADKKEKIHMARVSLMRCTVENCQCFGRIEVHHIRRGNSRRDHKKVIPLCEYHHKDNKNGYHAMHWSTFDKIHNIDTLALAGDLWKQTIQKIKGQ